MRISARDKRIIDILTKYPSIKEAANREGIAASTLYNWAQRHRQWQIEARNYINAMLGYRRKDHLLNKVLKPRKRAIHVNDDKDAEDNA